MNEGETLVGCKQCGGLMIQILRKGWGICNFADQIFL